MELDLVILGNLIVDDIVDEDGSTRMGQAGGANLYMGLSAPLWGLRTGLVSVVGTDYPRKMLDALENRGVDLGGVRTLPGPGLRTRLLYEGEVRRVVHRLDGASHRRASPTLEDIPIDWQPKAVHLAPMPFNLQRRLAAEVRNRFSQRVLLSLDPFELLTRERLDSWRDLVSDLDMLFLSEDEMASAEARLDPTPLLQDLFTGDLETLIYKRGSKGGLALHGRGTQEIEWEAHAVEVRDTTGAGDAFAAGTLAGLIQNRPLRSALEWGVVTASFAIEGQGASGLLAATSDEAHRRLESWFGG